MAEAALLSPPEARVGAHIDLGAITDGRTMVLDDLVLFKDGTATLHMRNGKVFELRECWHAGEGTVDTEESEISVRFEGLGGEEVRP